MYLRMMAAFAKSGAGGALDCGGMPPLSNRHHMRDDICRSVSFFSRAEGPIHIGQADTFAI